MGFLTTNLILEVGPPLPASVRASLENERLGTYRKELQGKGRVLFRSLDPRPNKSFVSFVVCLIDLLARRMLLTSYLGGY
jgi:hypothetical protein